MLPALQARKLNQECTAGNLSAQLLYDLNGRIHGTAGSQKIIHDQHPLSFFDAVPVNVQLMMCIRDSVIVVTSCFHVRRASYMVRKFFDDYVMQKTAEKEKCRHYITEYFRMWNSLRCELMLYRKRKR